MAGGAATVVAGDHPITTLLRQLHEVSQISAVGFNGKFKKDCIDLSRRVTLLAHLVDELNDSNTLLSCSLDSCFSDLLVAFQSVKQLLLVANQVDNKIPTDVAVKKINFQFQCVTWKLEKALASFPYDQFDISEEVQEQVELVRAQLRRATERYGGPVKSNLLYRASSQPLDKEIDLLHSGNSGIGTLHIENIGNIDHEVRPKVRGIPRGSVPNGSACSQIVQESERIGNSSKLSEVGDPEISGEDDSAFKSHEDSKKFICPITPTEFLCPISLELMRDPVIVAATGQTYERSCIQQWIDGGHTTCPKTQQHLNNFTLTPNYALRNLISDWCAKNDIEEPTVYANGKIKKSDGSFRYVNGEIGAIEVIVRKLSSRSIEDCRAAVAEIRSLSKRSTDNRILIAEAGAIPVLVKLLTSEDRQIQENAVTAVLNLSIFDDNKRIIMLADAIPSIVQVLRAGSMEARENAAATIFSLSLGDENKILIGASGAIPALIDLLQTGNTRGKKDAASALFNLCIYQGNKGRAVRAGIIPALLKMLTDSSSCMVDEALTILSVLASHQEAKAAIARASTIPVLIDLLRTGLPRSKENAAAILLSLCKRDSDNLASLCRLGAVIPLTELAKSGTERTKRKATSLLEHLRKSQQHSTRS
ncbi:U-box domain-containing protein 10 [Capsicum annuum]|uniref:U-box domain-containing protein 10 isoform X1 n=1 Tax=Capsicum annuum TaxID=4072 RepID=UPI0007BF70A0|nr:U-box domain-containing protein 10 isoform X1 [Capsicum annuum]KAF3632736.1 U-box domain-containing protein 10 [Capsicum annuum]KAF3641791.1 U-box domain-containing protein 10 [Capsicum annuum]